MIMTIIIIIIIIIIVIIIIVIIYIYIYIYIYTYVLCIYRWPPGSESAGDGSALGTRHSARPWVLGGGAPRSSAAAVRREAVGDGPLHLKGGERERERERESFDSASRGTADHCCRPRYPPSSLALTARIDSGIAVHRHLLPPGTAVSSLPLQGRGHGSDGIAHASIAVQDSPGGKHQH